MNKGKSLYEHLLVWYLGNSRVPVAMSMVEHLLSTCLFHKMRKDTWELINI